MLKNSTLALTEKLIASECELSFIANLTNELKASSDVREEFPFAIERQAKIILFETYCFH
jgi:hypothetical protein